MKRKRSAWRFVGIAVVVLIAVVAIATPLVLSLPQFGGELTGTRLARARANPQYRDGKFANPLPPASYTWADARALFVGQFFGDEVREPPGAIPVVPVTAASLQSPPNPGLRAFWIGHASLYVQLDGVRLLIDPVFSDYASPFEVGPKRFHPPPIALAALPTIDAVLITHDHYDHLDMRTVQQLARRAHPQAAAIPPPPPEGVEPNGRATLARDTLFVVPLGIGAHLERWGVSAQRIRELEWGQEHTLGGVRIVSTPARHYSGRRLGDRNATLWTSWSVIGARHRFFVSGDTGYSDHFRVIGEQFGPFDLAFVKVGAYGPGAPWLDIHMSAEDAVRAARDVRARRLFPEHWGTFNLAFHAWDEPIRRTLAAARANQVEVVTPRVGEIVDADAPFASSAWWEAVR
jgi:L-ascorbate metabolism protein UlaG (beta-lactamase superfamily)